MTTLRPILTCVLATCLLASAARPQSGRVTRIPPWREVDLPGSSLRLAEGWSLGEGTRFLGDVFPYLALGRLDADGQVREDLPLTTETLGRALRRTDGVVFATSEQALEAVRLFAAGPLVTSAAQVDRVVEAGKSLVGRLEHFELRFSGYRPEGYEPVAREIEPGRWEVSLVAFEMDRILRLVHLEGVVHADGRLALERIPLFVGPYTSWQVAWIDADGPTAADERIEREMRAEVELAYETLLPAIRPARDLDSFWAAGRIFDRLERFTGLFGSSDVLATAVVPPALYRLSDGTVVRLLRGAAAADGTRVRIGDVLHARETQQGPVHLHRVAIRPR